MIEMSPAMTDSFRIKDIWFSSLSFCLALFFLLSHRRDVIAKIVAALFSAVACTRCDCLAGVSSFHANLKICFLNCPWRFIACHVNVTLCLPRDKSLVSSSSFFLDFNSEAVNMNFGGWLTISGRASNPGIPGSNPGLAKWKQSQEYFSSGMNFCTLFILGGFEPIHCQSSTFPRSRCYAKKLIRRHFR